MSHLGEPEFLSRARAAAVAGLRGRVLEVGAGNGANLPFYEPGVDITLLEPEPYLLEKAEQRSKKCGRLVKLCLARAEELPFTDCSFDAVVTTLVLCSVSDPVRATAEIGRVLRPGGEFRFLEHVRSRDPLGAKVQNMLTPAWARIGGNCHLNRATVDLIGGAGLQMEELRPVNRSILLPMVVGMAKKVCL
jgi:ubiquinone/menaquinone biosynthesis C-methylase UbiE